MIRTARRSDATVPLGRVRRPALVVRGDRDPLVSATWADRLTRSLPRGSLTTIAGAPHAVRYSAVAPFVDALRDFLGMLERSAADS